MDDRFLLSSDIQVLYIIKDITNYFGFKVNLSHFERHVHTHTHTNEGKRRRDREGGREVDEESRREITHLPFYSPNIASS